MKDRVMEMKKEVRNKAIRIRLNDTEYKKIEGFWKASTCQDFSDYARTILQRKPVLIKYRNVSVDEILAEMIRLKNELNAIVNNFHGAINKLHTLDRLPEIRTWVLHNEKISQTLMSQVNEIKNRMNQIYKVWSQE